jgi:hypothetical protein
MSLELITIKKVPTSINIELQIGVIQSYSVPRTAVFLSAIKMLDGWERAFVRAYFLSEPQRADEHWYFMLTDIGNVPSNVTEAEFLGIIPSGYWTSDDLVLWRIP